MANIREMNLMGMLIELVPEMKEWFAVYEMVREAEEQLGEIVEICDDAGGEGHDPCPHCGGVITCTVHGICTPCHVFVYADRITSPEIMARFHVLRLITGMAKGDPREIASHIYGILHPEDGFKQIAEAVKKRNAQIEGGEVGPEVSEDEIVDAVRSILSGNNDRKIEA